jgi:hypothetical protein
MNHSTIQRIEGGWRIVTGDLVTVFGTERSAAEQIALLQREIERLRWALAEATGDSLTNLLRYAENLDEVHGGMAAIHVEYVPYTAHWQAQASWSDGDTVTHVGNSPSQAMERLERNLKAAAEAAKEKR